MGFTKKEYEFLGEIGVGLDNLGGYVDGKWKATGPVVSSVNPSNNQVWFCLTHQILENFFIFHYKYCIFKENYRDGFEFWLNMICRFLLVTDFLVLWVIVLLICGNQ